MVLDSRSRVDSTEKINGVSSVSNGSSDSSYKTIDLIIPPTAIPIAPKSSQNPIGNWWQSLGLQAKTTVISVAAITIPLLALGGFTYLYIGQNITNTTKQAKASLANSLGYRVAYFMAERYADIQVLAKRSFFINAKVRDVLPPAEQRVFLDIYIKAERAYDSIALYRLDGNLIVDSGTDPAPANISDRPYFQTVLQTDKPFISQPEPSVVTKKVSLFIAAPVKDSVTGKTIAVVRTRVKAEFLESTIQDFTAEGQKYQLSESDGKFFIASEKELVGRSLKADFPQLSSIIEKREIGSATDVDPISNKEQIVGYAPLPKIEGLPDLNWDAVISVDADIAFRPLQQLLLILVGATTGMGILAVVLAIAISRRATRPIIEATAAVSELGRGNLDTRLAVQGQDEMAQLGGNINLMAGQLQTFLALQETQSRRSQILAEVSRSRDLDELETPLNRYMADIRQELNCDRVVVYRFMDDGLGVTKGIIVAEDGLAHLTNAKAAGLSDPCIPRETLEAYKNGRIVAIYDGCEEGCVAPADIKLLHPLQMNSN